MPNESTPHNSPRAQKLQEVDEEVLRNRNAFFQKKFGKLKTKYFLIFYLYKHKLYFLNFLIEQIIKYKILIFIFK